MKKESGCPITIGDFNRLMNNLDVCKKLNEEQMNWLEEFIEKHDHNLKKVILQLNDGVLWVIINTKNSVRQFSKE
jgi:hypothetical protein